MSNNQSEGRPTAYLWWSRVIAIVLAIVLALLWFTGYGPFGSKTGNCCGNAVAVATAPVPAASPAPAPAAVQPAPAVATPAPVVEAPKVDNVCPVALAAAVGFNSGSVQLSADGQKALDAMVGCLKNGGTVTGHTDNVGGDALNQSLSERRANSVVKYLSGQGVVGLVAQGKGESAPVADNATAEGRAKNRRMEIVAK